MRNRVAYLAALAAAVVGGGLGGVAGGGDRVMSAAELRNFNSGKVPGVPNNGVAGFGKLSSIISGGGGWGGSPHRPTYKNRAGVSCAESKRRAVKTRNRLRARGQFRDAVR